MKTWVIVGASRGIGKGFVQQALERGDVVHATVRKPDEQTVAALWPQARPGQCHIYACDMLSEASIHAFADQLSQVPDLHVDYVVLNAGILHYPNRATEISYAAFTLHLQTNTIGPIITAQSLLRTLPNPIKTLIFICSDSGSTQRFRPEEDGFAVYAASKAALNQALRHMAAELERKGSGTKVLALHPGEVETDMAANDLGWEVEGQMSVRESVGMCMRTIEEKGNGESGTFWTWEGKPYPW